MQPACMWQRMPACMHRAPTHRARDAIKTSAHVHAHNVFAPNHDHRCREGGDRHCCSCPPARTHARGPQGQSSMQQHAAYDAWGRQGGGRARTAAAHDSPPPPKHTHLRLCRRRPITRGREASLADCPVPSCCAPAHPIPSHPLPARRRSMLLHRARKGSQAKPPGCSSSRS